MLGRAPGQTVAEFKRATTRAVAAADPQSAAERHRRANAARTMERMAQPDGMESLLGHHAGLRLQPRVGHPDRPRQGHQAELRAGAGDDPGLDALRVDALVDAILGPATHLPPQPAAPPVRTPGAGCRAARCGGGQTAAVVLDLPTAARAGGPPG